jgi:hypothetical protein
LILASNFRPRYDLLLPKLNGFCCCLNDFLLLESHSFTMSATSEFYYQRKPSADDDLRTAEELKDFEHA